MTREEFVRLEAGRQWNSAKEKVERDRWASAVPVTVEEIAREAVRIARALADACGLQSEP